MNNTSIKNFQDIDIADFMMYIQTNTTGIGPKLTARMTDTLIRYNQEIDQMRQEVEDSKIRKLETGLQDKLNLRKIFLEDAEKQEEEKAKKNKIKMNRRKMFIDKMGVFQQKVSFKWPIKTTYEY
tara:strand:+ start:341 stop:715 length:375 start_codon:yes stop_codon:yes gene_type:complete